MGCIYLETLGIELELPGHSFRDDGPVKHIRKHTKKIYQEFDLLDTFYSTFGPFEDILPDDFDLSPTGARTVNLEKNGIKYHIIFYKKTDYLNTLFLRAHEEAEALLSMNHPELLEKKFRLDGVNMSFNGLENHFIASLAGFYVLSKNGLDIANVDPATIHPHFRKALRMYKAKSKK